MTVDALHASVFDAGSPELGYDDTDTPAQVYPRIQSAQRLAPIALGPNGPEVLSHELVRAVLRDTRFQIPPGISLAVQGISSGPLWEKVVNSLLCLEGAEHHTALPDPDHLRVAGRAARGLATVFRVG